MDRPHEEEIARALRNLIDHPLRAPDGNVSVEEAIAEEICARAHHRGSTYFGGHCEECMGIAMFAVRTVVNGMVDR